MEVWLLNAAHMKTVPGRAKSGPVDRTIGGEFGRCVRWPGLGWLGSLLVIGDGDLPRDLAVLVVPGARVAGGDWGSVPAVSAG